MVCICYVRDLELHAPCVCPAGYRATWRCFLAFGSFAIGCWSVAPIFGRRVNNVASLSSIHIVQTQELHLFKYISSLSSFLKDWILHWIPALAVHGVILDWLLALYVHRVRNLFHGLRFDEAFFKQSFQPPFFLQIKGFSCFWKGFYAVVLLLCHFIFIKIFRKPRRLIEPKELIHCLFCFSH